MRALTIIATLLLSAVCGFAANVSGDWTMTLESPQGTLEASLTLKQDGDKVTGTYKGPRNEAPATGTLKGDDLSLSITIDAGGQSITLEITGKVDGDKMQGSLDFAGQAVPFKATKKP